MDPNRDNPLIRFSAFWWGLGIVLIFAVLLAVITFMNRGTADGLEEVAAQKRYQIKADIDTAQAEELSHEAIEAAIPATAKKLAASKPVAVVPEVVEVDVPIDPEVMALGQAQYLVCGACHGQQGEGVPNLAPPLANSEWVNGPAENLIRIQLRGLTGPITVAGKQYNFATGMAALSYQTDEQVAAVLTYVRNSFGNKAPAITPEQVNALRGEVGKPQLTVEDLIQP